METTSSVRGQPPPRPSLVNRPRYRHAYVPSLDGPTVPRDVTHGQGGAFDEGLVLAAANDLRAYKADRGLAGARYKDDVLPGKLIVDREVDRTRMLESLRDIRERLSRVGANSIHARRQLANVDHALRDGNVLSIEGLRRGGPWLSQGKMLIQGHGAPGSGVVGTLQDVRWTTDLDHVGRKTFELGVLAGWDRLDQRLRSCGSAERVARKETTRLLRWFHRTRTKTLDSSTARLHRATMMAREAGGASISVATMGYVGRLGSQLRPVPNHLRGSGVDTHQSTTLAWARASSLQLPSGPSARRVASLVFGLVQVGGPLTRAGRARVCCRQAAGWPARPGQVGSRPPRPTGAAGLDRLRHERRAGAAAGSDGCPGPRRRSGADLPRSRASQRVPARTECVASFAQARGVARDRAQGASPVGAPRFSAAIGSIMARR